MRIAEGGQDHRTVKIHLGQVPKALLHLRVRTQPDHAPLPARHRLYHGTVTVQGVHTPVVEAHRS